VLQEAEGPLVLGAATLRSFKELQGGLRE